MAVRQIPSPLTTLQEKKLKKAIKKNRTEGIYNCKTCGTVMKGMDLVNNHVDNHGHHSYGKFGSTLVLCIG